MQTITEGGGGGGGRSGYGVAAGRVYPGSGVGGGGDFTFAMKDSFSGYGSYLYVSAAVGLLVPRSVRPLLWHRPVFLGCPFVHVPDRSRCLSPSKTELRKIRTNMFAPTHTDMIVNSHYTPTYQTFLLFNHDVLYLTCSVHKSNSTLSIHNTPR